MKIAVIGLGLIGGSLLKSLKPLGHNLIVISRNAETLKKAGEYANEVSDDLTALKTNFAAELVFVCTPMSATLEVLDKLDKILDKNTLVADVCSLKSFVMQKASEHPYRFIGTHPMAGSEKSGFDASFEGLFKGSKWVLTPPDGSKNDDIELLKNIINSLGAKVVFAGAQEHDFAAAMISHLPLLISQALVLSTEENILAKTLAAGGFRDMTRLSLSDSVLACDMMTLNSENIDAAYENLLAAVKTLKNCLKNEKYCEKIEHIKDLRKEIYDKSGKNIYNPKI